MTVPFGLQGGSQSGLFKSTAKNTKTRLTPMATHSPNDLRKGNVINYQDAPHLVLEAKHRTQGRQAGFVQTAMRNLSTGSTTNVKFRSTHTVEILRTEVRKLEFSYVDDKNDYFFIDPEAYEKQLEGMNENYEETVLPAKLVTEQKPFLIENLNYEILFVGGKAIAVQLPAIVDMTVADAPKAIRGDTATGAEKSVTTETGLVVQTPLFIETGDRIRVKTDGGVYDGRSKDDGRR